MYTVTTDTSNRSSIVSPRTEEEKAEVTQGIYVNNLTRLSGQEEFIELRRRRSLKSHRS
jgi:hypothetical protein